jgi:hypothetical protein
LNDVFDVDTEYERVEPEYNIATLNLLMIACVAVFWLSTKFLHPWIYDIITATLDFVILSLPLIYAKLAKLEDPDFSLSTP